MLIKIPLLSFLIFGVTYPLFFWLTAKNPIKHNFHRFHLACPVVIAGLAIFGTWLIPFPHFLRFTGVIWLTLALGLTAYSWNKEKVNVYLVSLISILGLILYVMTFKELLGSNPAAVIISVLSGLMVAAIFYAMNLGHFYLNVLGLKIDHLKNAVTAFGILTALRFIWDLVTLFSATVMYGGEEQSLFKFAGTLDGFLLWVAFFFGCLFPLCGLYFALGTLKLKNTQATTGILYVLLSAVLLGDLAFKFYLIKFNISM